MYSICVFTLLLDPIWNWNYLYWPLALISFNYLMFLWLFPIMYKLCMNKGYLKVIIISAWFLPSCLLSSCALFVFVLLVLALIIAAIRLHSELSASVVTVSGCTVAKARWRREDAGLSSWQSRAERQLSRSAGICFFVLGGMCRVLLEPVKGCTEHAWSWPQRWHSLEMPVY